MNIPSLPTDSLYKFMSISGIIIIIVSVMYGHSQISKWNQLALEIAAELIIVEAESDYLQNELKYYPKESRSIKNRKLLREIKLKIAQVKAKNTELESILKSKVIFKYGVGIGVGIGVSLSYLGFHLWYSRIQKYQDAILASQAKEFEASSSKKPSGS